LDISSTRRHHQRPTSSSETDQEWDSVLAVNLKARSTAPKRLPAHDEAKVRRIINICSIVGLMGNAGQPNYSASKGGLIAMHEDLREEFASRKILVNAIRAGIHPHPHDRCCRKSRKNKELSSMIPLTRLGEPE